jgi:hypothetical protein
VTAAEIREKFSEQPNALVSAQILILAEIAAQLAEMNERATEPELEKLRKELREEIAKWRPKGETSI